MIMRRINFKRSMLEYCKLILSKISFDRKLFRKEYRKTFGYLQPEEQSELKKWLRSPTKTLLSDTSAFVMVLVGEHGQVLLV